MLVFQQCIRWSLLIILSTALIGCAPAPKETLRIAINPWPGYEILYIAKERGFFERVGLDVELVPAGSLADSQRAYLRGTVDGLTSTLIEVIQIQSFNTKPLKIALIPDYSLGGDVIISNTDINSVTQLKDKSVGTEVSSLGIYILARALQLNEMSLNDIDVINTEQNAGHASLLSKSIEAFVTYPPVSLKLLEDNSYHVLFDSKQLPREIFDVVSISEQYLNDHPNTIEKLHEAWQLALDELEQNPSEAIAIMAPKEGLTEAQFKQALESLVLIPKSQQQPLLQSEELELVIQQVCNTLIAIRSIENDCQSLHSLKPALSMSNKI